MIGILINYLTQKFQTFNYLQTVYGLAGFEDGDNKYLWVYQNNEKVLLNLDTHQSCSLFLTNGKVDTTQEESQLVANEYNVVKKYPFKTLVYIQGNENVNCITESQKIADSIQKSITGRQKQILASTQLTDAYIDVTGTNFVKEEIYKQYYSTGGLQEKDILVEIEFDFVVSGNQDCFVDSPCSDDEYIFSFDAPKTFCERVDECLDIPTADGQYVLDITDGVKSWSQYSPSGAVVITKTQAQFLALVSGSTLQFPATYKITDIKNGLFVETLSANTFKSEATLSFLAPDYSLHAQYHSTDGAIANGATVTWGGFYWTNISGGSVTPDLPNEADIDTDLAQFDKLSKSTANGYVAILLQVIVDTSLNIIKATDKYNNSIEIKSDDYTYQSVTIDNYQWNLSSTGFYNNQCFISNNVLESGGKLLSNQTVGGMFIKRCKIDSTSAIVKNVGLGNDFQVGEINNCIVSNLGFISQNELHVSYIKDTNVDGDNTGAGIGECYLTTLSFIDGCSISGSDCYFASCWFELVSGIRNVDVNTNNTALNCVELYDQTVIENFTLPSGAQIRSYVSNHSIDLTGFGQSFIQNNENGVGFFTEEIYFATSNLSSGSSLLKNLIPNGAKLTKIAATGTLTGTNIEIGLETDDEAIISGAVGLLPLTWEGFSNAATANRSLKIKATGGNITSGTLTVKAEFIV